MRHSTSIASRRGLRPRVVALVLGLTLASLTTIVPAALFYMYHGLPHVVHASGSNPIVTENQQPGTTAWQIDADASGNPLLATNHQIEGYASLTSVNQGGTISFMVSLSASAQYNMDIYRMGYYPNGCTGPCGGRLMQHVGPLSGSTQANCPTVTTTTSTTFGLIECNWTPSYTLTVPAAWTTGSYIVKLTRLDDSLEMYMTFVVRSDAGQADIVLSEDVTTWQAYNMWGGAGNNNVGYDLYGKFNDVTYNNTSSTRAYTVSFDRPYLDQSETDGAGNFMLWDYPMIRWLESQGYNVTYATDIDLESNPSLLSGRKAFINVGHDEYYSDNMRANLQADINAGVNVGFFSANNIYNRIVFNNNPSGQAYRRIFCDKGAFQPSTTIQWRSLNPPQPENAIVGVMQNGVANDRPFEVYNASSWIFQGTGLSNYTGGTPILSGPGQNAIKGLVGYEFDERADNDSGLSAYVTFDPAGLQQVAHSNVPASDNGVAAFSDATLYTASSGATVFAAGTIQWAWGLDNGYNDGFCNCSPGYLSTVAQQITTNILTHFLSSSGAPGASLSPTSVSFGNQNIGSTSAAQTVTLTNSGTAALSITGISLTGTNAADFAQTNTCPSGSAMLAAGANCTINVTYTPSVVGSETASLSVADNANGSPQTAALSGTGVQPAAPVVTLAPTSVSFGNQTQGTTSAAQTVTLTNSGTAALSITGISVTGTNAADFTQTNTCPISPSTLAAGANCTISVTFTPSTTNNESASVSIADNANGSPQSVPLTGTGVAPNSPAVTLSPTSVSFGNQQVGTTSAAQTVTLTNSGTAALSITGISLTGANAADFAQTNTCPISPSTLAAGANCTISVTFTPSITGAESGSLSITDNASGSPHTAALSGTGAVPAVTLSPTSLSFASQTIGTTSAAQTVTLTNSGNASLTISGISITGTNAADFAQTNTCPSGSTPLAAGASCTISVTFTPSVGGAESASLSIADNAAGSPQSAALSGTGNNGTYFADGFESGNFSAWSGQPSGTGQASVENTVVNSGSYSAAFTIATGQYEFMSANLSGGGQQQTYTRFYFQIANVSTSSQIAYGQDASGNKMWEIDYDSGRHGLDIYFWNGARARLDLYSNTNVIALNTWYSVEIQDAETSTGTGQVWLNGTSIGSVSGDLSATSYYTKLNLYSEAVGTTYWDDVVVSRNYNGPLGYVPTPSVQLTPTSVSFGYQATGSTSAAQTVTLTNTGTGSLSITSIGFTGTNAADFAQTNTCPSGSATLAAGAHCSINVTFTPSIIGAETASLSIADNATGSPHTAALSGSGLAPNTPIVTLSPTTLAFGNQTVGTTSAAKTVTLTSSGTGPLTITSIGLTGANAADFAQTNTCPISPSTLAVGANCTISVTFTPSIPNGETANLTVTDNAADSPQAAVVSGNGVNSGTYFADGFESGDFSAWSGQPSGTGQASVENTVVNSGAYAGAFTIGASGQYKFMYANLTGGGQQQSYTRFYLRLSGVTTSTALAYGKDVNGNRMWEIDYDANRHGLDAYFWNGARTRTDLFSATNILSMDTWYSVELQDVESSTGTGQLWLNGTSIGSVSADLSATSYYAQLNLYTEAVGTTYWDDVVVSHNYNGPLGYVPTPGVQLAPTSLSFGNQTQGTTSAAQAVTLTDSGGAALSITSIGFTGTNAADFAQTNTCPISPSTLAAGASCTINVTFKPSVVGAETASLSIADNANGGSQTVAVSGTGVQPAAPAVTLAPTSLSFGNQAMGSTSAAQTVTLTNSGNAALSITSISVTGTNAADFAQTNTCPSGSATLAAGANCTISVTFKPSVTGSEAASLSIADNASGSPQTAALSGTGTAPAVTLAPATVAFNNQVVRTTSLAQTVTLTNSGTAALSITSISVTGTNAADFAQTNTCPTGSATLVAGASCTLSITFTPTLTSGETGSLSFTDNAAGSPQTVALSGTGVNSATYFADGFESGNFKNWSGKPSGTGQPKVESTVVHSGTFAASFTIASGQTESMYGNLSGGGQQQSYTRFYVRLSGVTTSTMLAYGQDANGNKMWEIDYDVNRHGLDIYFWNGARTRTDLYSNTNVIALNTWYGIELRDVETSTGMGQVWLNGTSIGSVSADLSATSYYARLTLYTQAVGTTYWDDVAISNAF